jgi:hypothetical protein
MAVRRPERLFVWKAVSNGRAQDAGEGAEALRWLGKRLAYERWLQDLRDGEPEPEPRAVSA